MTISKTSIMIAATLSLLGATAAPAQSGMLQNDPNRPVEAIAADLGITADQFVVCFNDVNPLPGGGAPDSARAHANKAALLPCLQAANPTITNQFLDEVMDRHRPEGRVANS